MQFHDSVLDKTVTDKLVCIISIVPVESTELVVGKYQEGRGQNVCGTLSNQCD